MFIAERESLPTRGVEDGTRRGLCCNVFIGTAEGRGDTLEMQRGFVLDANQDRGLRNVAQGSGARPLCVISGMGRDSGSRKNISLESYEEGNVCVRGG